MNYAVRITRRKRAKWEFVNMWIPVMAIRCIIWSVGSKVRNKFKCTSDVPQCSSSMNLKAGTRSKGDNTCTMFRILQKDVLENHYEQWKKPVSKRQTPCFFFFWYMTANIETCLNEVVTLSWSSFLTCGYTPVEMRSRSLFIFQLLNIISSKLSLWSQSGLKHISVNILLKKGEKRKGVGCWATREWGNAIVLL